MNAGKGHPPRLQGWNYSCTSAYFVTVKVDGGRPVLSAIVNGSIVLSRWGEIVRQCLVETARRFPLEVDLTVIMPDHVHTILFLATEQVCDRAAGWRPMMSDPTQMLGKVVRAWKAKSTHEIRASVDQGFGWQSRYFEHVIRSQQALDRIRIYIRDNPRRRCQAGDQKP